MPDRSAIEVLIGLRNPGEKYVQTRHNAGQWFVDLLLAQYSLKLSSHKSWPLEAAQLKGLNLLLPTTYMNLSGQGIGQFCRYYKIPSAAILVAHDDVDLPVGAIKLKFGGGDGGHNGLKSLIDHLQSRQFWRLRIGIGRPPMHDDTSDYVLKKPMSSERAAIDDALILAQQNFEQLLLAEFDAFMRLVHPNNKANKDISSNDLGG